MFGCFSLSEHAKRHPFLWRPWQGWGVGVGYPPGYGVIMR